MTISLLVTSMIFSLIYDYFKFITYDLKVLHLRHTAKCVICENVYIFIIKRVFLAKVFHYLLN